MATVRQDKDIQRRRALGTLCAVVFFSVALVTLSLRVGPGPAWLGRMASGWAAAQGLPFTVEAVQVTGWGTAVLRGVEYVAPPRSGEAPAFRSEEAAVVFDPVTLLRGGASAAVKEIIMSGPRLVLAPFPSGTASNAPAKDAAAPPDASGTQGSGAAGIVRLPPLRPEGVRVTVSDGLFSWQGDNPVTVAVSEFTGTVRQDGITVDRIAAELAVGGHTYRLGDGQGEVRLGDGGLSVTQFAAKLDGGHVQVSGGIAWDTALDLAVDGAFDDLAAALPFLAARGFAGPGTFKGRLTGTLAAWELQGESSVGPGRVWGRENVSGSGTLRVTAAGADFRNVLLYQYGGEYRLDGSWRYGPGTEPGSLDLRLQTDSARLQEVLALVGWQAPVTGRLSGELHFAGPTDQVAVRGDVVVSEAVVAEQPLDRIAGTFAWDAGRLHVSEAELRLGGGSAHLAGELDLLQRRVDMAFAADEWPLGFTGLFDRYFGQTLGGMVSVRRGRLSGSLDAPQVSGEVAADVLRVGPAYFRSVQGRVAYDAGVLRLADLVGVRAGGGKYALSGSLDLSAAGGPVADLALQVEAERLGSLLQLAGEDLPAALLDGHVSGSIQVTGALRDPVAQLDFSLSETLVMKRGVRVLMQYADGNLTVQELDFSAGAPASG